MKSLVELLDRQARRWSIERGAGMPAQRGAVVAIACQPWARGDEIAELVAGWLDYGLFGVEALEALASDPSLRGRLVEGLDAPARKAIEARMEPIAESRSARELADLARVVAALGERGMAVVVGDGAALVLPAERTLRVLLVSPRGDRMARLSAARDLAAPAASAELDRQDEARLRFLRDRLGLTGDDPALFDVVLNTGHLVPEAAAALVVEALRRRFPPGSGPGA